MVNFQFCPACGIRRAANTRGEPSPTAGSFRKPVTEGGRSLSHVCPIRCLVLRDDSWLMGRYRGAIAPLTIINFGGVMPPFFISKYFQNMNSKFIQKVKAKIQEEKEWVQQELNRVASPDKGDHVIGQYRAAYPNYGDDVSDDNTSSSQEVEEYERNLGLTTQFESRLESLEKALQKIENNTYGICEQCGKEIPEGRLEANPGATTCVACASHA